MSSGQTRKRLETFKAVVFVSVPLTFGYVLGRIPQFWEWAAEIVSLKHDLHGSGLSFVAIHYASGI